MASVHDPDLRGAGADGEGSVHTLLDEAEAAGHVGHWTWRPGSGLPEWSPEIYRILGRDPAGPVPDVDTMRGFLSPASFARAAEVIEQVLATRGPYRVEIDFDRPDGTHGWAEIRGEPRLAADGSIERLVGVFVDISDRKALELATAAATAEVRAALDAMVETVAIVGFDWRYRYRNAASLRLTGHTAEASLGRAITDISPALVGSALHECYQRVMATRQPETVATELPFPQGTIWGEVNVYPHPDGIMIVGIDRTAEHKVEAATRDSEAQLRAAFEESPETFLLIRPIFDDDGRFVDGEIRFPNRLSRERYLDDLPIEAIVGQRLFTRWPKYRDLLFDAYRRVAEERVAFTLPVHSTRADGEYWSDLRFYPLGNDRFVHSGHDTTASRRAAAELEQSEARYRLLAENASDMVFQGSGDRGLEWVSPSVRDLLGFDPEELAARFPRDLVHPDDVPAVAAARARRLESGRGDYRARYRRRDGTYRWLDVSVRSVGDGQVVGSARDVQQQVEAEVALAAAQRQVALAEQARLVGQLAGGVAHDYNNILAAILGYADLLAAELPSGSPQEADLMQIRDAARRAAELTRRLLTYGRRDIVAPTAIDAEALLQSLRPLVVGVCGETVKVAIEAASPTPPLLADRVLVERAVLNLVVNAREAMPGGGTLTLSAEATHLAEGDVLLRPGVVPGRFVRIAVIDTGTGIPPDVLPHVLEPFFSTKATAEGAGLGLASVDGAMAQMGGLVAIDSEPGRGTTVSLYLPVAVDAPSLEPSAGSDAPAAPTGALTVLLVEDGEVVRRVVARILDEAGHRVIEAASGDEAVAHFAETHGLVDLLVTDVVMPGMNGAVLAERLRARRLDLPVVFMSGYTPQEAFPGKEVPLGTVFLAKPFQASGLLAAIASALPAPRP